VTLIQTLFDGPLDIVGDVHGEIDALCSLLRHLGYSEDGSHPARRLVFLGDLADRGPDSPAVVDFVQSLIGSGRAQCVLGNHDFNIMVDHDKPENKWFYGVDFLAKDGSVVSQVLADEPTRQRVRAFFRTLPLALERDDLRVAHACWHDEMIAVARDADDAVTLYEHHRDLIDGEPSESDLDVRDKGLRHQNHNPVKLLTSGPEERTDEPIEAGGKIPHERRVPWWNDYRDDVFCVFGHYSQPVDQSHGNGRTFCADYAVGKRWMERREAGFDGSFRRTKLAAVRFPERMVVFDNGTAKPCVP